MTLEMAHIFTSYPFSSIHTSVNADADADVRCGQGLSCDMRTDLRLGNGPTPLRSPSEIFNIDTKQECIPVGCVPPAHWSYLVISHTHPHACPLQPCMPPATTYVPLATTHVPWQPCMPPSNHAPPPATMHPRQPHMPPWQWCMPPGNHACPLATMHVPWQPCMPPSNHACPPTTMHTPRQPCMLPSNHACPPWQPRMPPPVDRITDTCKNITLPQTSFAGGKNHYIKTEILVKSCQRQAMLKICVSPSIFGVACPWIMCCGSSRLPGSPLQPTSNNMGILYTPGEAIDIIGLTILPKPEFWNWEKYFRLLTEHVQLQVVEKQKKYFQ